ncbi:DUF192 domain-containing protein [Sphingomonas rubra]|uniref:DUF192 domain-containing protein n=1 Tax=Sphingomonas rubra TaxID=634430 RepID=A0A1I5SSQ9_9SPHN|nr:DUF192 domain-containing protein [Sphingomonas rubra]SFP73286.1 hypothetical protein SAMN04488241_10683 [Sphingomonas rubra]
MRAAALLLLLALPGCRSATDAPPICRAAGTVPVTVTGATKRHTFCVEVARTVDEQARGLMYRTDIAADGGMLFAPYPPDGGAPREASFWMENTPSPLDIVFIRADGTIARVAENTVPFDRAPVPSGEPVAAVLEVRGGRMAELGLAAGDRVRWPAIAVEGAAATR